MKYIREFALVSLAFLWLIGAAWLIPSGGLAIQRGDIYIGLCMIVAGVAMASGLFVALAAEAGLLE